MSLSDSFKEALRRLIANDEGHDPAQIEIMDYWESEVRVASMCETCSYEHTQVFIDYEVGGVRKGYAYDSTFRDLIFDLDRVMEGKRS